MGGCAALVGGLVFASRFLKTAILNGEKKFKTRTLGRMWRAGVCIWVGGSMKGEEERAARAARAPERSGSPVGGCGGVVRSREFEFWPRVDF